MIKLLHNEVWFTSDPHLGHANIIKYCNRPYANVEEMNKQIILNWNNLVKPEHHIFITGDFAFANGNAIKNFLEQLNGHKYLIKGNHDHQINFPKQYPYFELVEEQLEVRIIGDLDVPSQDIFLNHYPMISWNQSHRGSWQLFGHIHSTPGNNKIKNIQSPNQYDIGMDNNNYCPLSFAQIREIITKQNLNGIF